MKSNVVRLRGVDPAGDYLEQFGLHDPLIDIKQTRFAINFLKQSFVGGALRNGLTTGDFVAQYERAIRAQPMELTGTKVFENLTEKLHMSNASSKLKQDKTRYQFVVVRSARNLISDEITKLLEKRNYLRRSLLETFSSFYQGHILESARPYDRRHVMSKKALEARFIGELMSIILTTHAIYGEDVSLTIDRLNECEGLIRKSFENALTVPLHTHIAFSKCQSVCYAVEIETDRRGRLLCENMSNKSILVVNKIESSTLLKDLSLLSDEIEEMQKGYIMTYNRNRDFTHYVDDYSFDGGGIRFTALCSFFKKLPFDDSSNIHIGKLTLFRRPNF